MASEGTARWLSHGSRGPGNDRSELLDLGGQCRHPAPLLREQDPLRRELIPLRRELPLLLREPCEEVLQLRGQRRRCRCRRRRCAAAAIAKSKLQRHRGRCCNRQVELR